MWDIGCEEGPNNLPEREHMGNNETITGLIANVDWIHIHDLNFQHDSD